MTTYIVSNLGDDFAPGTVMDPFATIEHAKTVMHGGDTLMLRGGTYPEGLAGLPSGLGTWNTATTIEAYEGEPVIISGEHEGYLYYTSDRAWIVFNDLVLDGIDGTKDAINIGNYAHHHRFINCEMLNAATSAFNLKGHHNEILDTYIHDGGRYLPQGYGVYIKGQDNLVRGCEITRMAGMAIHIFDNESWLPDRNSVIENHIHHNGWSDRYSQPPGIGIYVGIGNIARSNNIHDEHTGVIVNYGARDTLVETNAIADCLRGIYVGDGAGTSFDDGGHDTILRGNVFTSCVIDILDEGIGTIIDDDVPPEDPPEDPPEEPIMGAVDDIQAAIDTIRIKQAEIEAELASVESALVELVEADELADTLAEKL